MVALSIIKVMEQDTVSEQHYLDELLFSDWPHYFIPGCINLGHMYSVDTFWLHLNRF